MNKKSPRKNSPRRVEKQVAHCYSTWGKTYFKDYYRSPKAYPPVHVSLVERELKSHEAGNLLDAGCGPASMLRQLRFFGSERYGFDLTPEMVEEAKSVLARQGVDPSHVWEGSVLDADSYKQPRAGKRSKPFDAAVCFGVLPHIDEESDPVVFANLRRAVRKGGVVLVEARNELFSLFTSNRYTHEFIIGKLANATSISGASTSEKKALQDSLGNYRKLFRMDLPPVRKGKAGEPGYDEVLSRVHNPFVARRQFEEAGFRDVRVLFYHYHWLPPMMEAAAPRFYRRKSLSMENPEDWRGHFMASAFVLCGIAS
jgi:2-polyprenyl-3-methyl-5-hydroxy-6-metoxy-1,4-benzoquinol methylase